MLRSLTCKRVSLQDPVVTNEGYIFSKEAILQYFLDQKKAKKQQLAEWEADEARRLKLVRLTFLHHSTAHLPHASGTASLTAC
jgi:Zinc-finger of nitric oxide synthase-interacting protein